MAGCSSFTRTSSRGRSSSYESSRGAPRPRADRPAHAVRTAADPLALVHDLRTAGRLPLRRAIVKAFVVKHYGKDGLRAADVPEPEVGDGDVLVKVSAAGINPLDKMVRNGVPVRPDRRRAGVRRAGPGQRQGRQHARLTTPPAAEVRLHSSRARLVLGRR